MTDKEFNKQLNLIATSARIQQERGYTAESDATTALALIQSLATLLVENDNARKTYRGCCSYCAGRGCVESSTPPSPDLVCPACHGSGQYQGEAKGVPTVPELHEIPPDESIATAFLDDTDSVERQGGWAYTFGMSLDRNPYPKSMKKHFIWEAGWYCAEEGSQP